MEKDFKTLIRTSKGLFIYLRKRMNEETLCKRLRESFPEFTFEQEPDPLLIPENEQKSERYKTLEVLEHKRPYSEDIKNALREEAHHILYARRQDEKVYIVFTDENGHYRKILTSFHTLTSFAESDFLPQEITWASQHTLVNVMETEILNKSTIRVAGVKRYLNSDCKERIIQLQNKLKS